MHLARLEWVRSDEFARWRAFQGERTIIQVMAFLAVSVLLVAEAALAMNFGKRGRGGQVVRLGMKNPLRLTPTLSNTTPHAPMYTGIKFTSVQMWAWAESALISVAIEWLVTNPYLLLLETTFKALVRSRFVRLMASRDRELQARIKRETETEYEYEFEYDQVVEHDEGDSDSSMD